MQRRLSAILSADVVAYTRLMGADEAGTLERLKSLRRTLVQPNIAKRRGRIVKLMGDGLLAEFASVVEAVGCAVEIQEGMAAHEAGLPDDGRIRLRIGVNLGDVIIEGSDIYGDGVNVAARLEGLADPGGICISGTAFDTIGGKLAEMFEDQGALEMKNVARPVRVYRLAAPAGPGGAPGSAPAAASARPTIAVLPFANMSGDPGQEYFSDGITEDLITELSRFRELAVISRSSSFVFKGKSADARRICAELKAQYLVEGSIRKSGARVRVTVQLIDAERDRHVWADRYDREIEDILALQDDIVRRVASTLVARLEHQREERTRLRSENELKVYDLYLRAREHFFSWSLGDNTRARDLLQTALGIEPRHAAALALQSEVLLRMWLNGWSDAPDADLRGALELAEAAVEIDDEDSRTHMALGIALLFQKLLDRARHHFERAQALNPNDTRVLIYFSRHAVFAGDPARAIDLCREAQVLNPYGKYSLGLGIACFVARRYAEAIEQLESIGNPPETVHALIAASHAMAGHADAARQSRDRLLDAARSSPMLSRLRGPEAWRDYFTARWPFRDASDREHLFVALRAAGLPL